MADHLLLPPARERGRGLHRIAWDLRASAPAGDEASRGGTLRGAQVLPGVYTVKMIAGPAAVEQKVTIDIDPELKTSPADLQTQWPTLEKISEMIRTTEDMLRQSGRHADSPPWTRFRDSLTAGGIAQQLQSLFGLVDGSNATPTQAMNKLLSELESDFDRSLKEFRTLER